MLDRRCCLSLAAAVIIAASAPAFAATKYSASELRAAMETGRPVLVEISAPWCPVCKAQKAVLSELDKQERFKGFVKIEVDFDTQKDALRSLKADKQSTLIVFKGEAELGRLVGVSSRDAIEGLLARAL